MQFWDGMVGTALVVGLAVSIFYVIISILIPEIGPEEHGERWGKEITKDRWLQIAGVLYLVGIALELSKSYIPEAIFGLAKLTIVGAGLLIFTVLATDFILQYQRRYRPRSHNAR